jgi:beta-lactam-binding protein with PASTA domain
MQIRLIVGALSLVALAGCGSSASSSTETTTSLKPTTTVAVTTPPTTVATTTTTVRVTTTMGSGSQGRMPNVVGMNLQAAQNLIQSEADVFYSRSFDCTGQGRNQIVDSNWVVVTQTPSPGSPISEGTANLGVVKIGESRSC